MRIKTATTFVLVTALAIGTALVQAKEKRGAFLGIVPGEITSKVSDDYGVKPGEGVIVEGVTTDSPADDAGLRVNDVITAISGSSITGPEELRHQLSKLNPKDTVDLTILRGGKTRTVSVTLDNRDDEQMGWTPRVHMERHEGPMAFHFFDGQRDRERHRGYAGLYLQELSKGLAEYFKVEEGVLVSEVVKNSPADKAGLKSGDVIVSVGGESVQDESDVRSEIRDHKPGETLDFKIKRDGVEKTVTVTLGDVEEDGEDMGDVRWFELDGDQFTLAPEALEGIQSLEGLNDIQAHIEDLNIKLKDGAIQLDGVGDLENKLRDLEIRMQDLPPMQLEMDISTPPAQEMEMRKARPIWDRTVWMDTWEKIKNGLDLQMKAWEDGLAKLRTELNELREEIMQRIA